MDIIIDKYILKPSEGSPSRWDLYERKIRNKKDSEEKIDFEQIIAYCIQLETCIKYIVSINLSEDKSIVDLKEFSISYKNEVDRINNLIK